MKPCIFSLRLSKAFCPSFTRVRPWARRLGYAEWDLRPQCINQIPHLLAILLQVHIRSLWPQAPTGNVQTLILPEEARLSAESAGWTVIEEKIIDTSTQLGYGKSWEIHNTLEMVEQFTGSISASEHICSTLCAKKQLLNRLSNEAQKCRRPRILSWRNEGLRPVVKMPTQAHGDLNRT